jgi:hypothetical protein
MTVVLLLAAGVMCTLKIWGVSVPRMPRANKVVAARMSARFCKRTFLKKPEFANGTPPHCRAWVVGGFCVCDSGRPFSTRQMMSRSCTSCVVTIGRH